MGTSLQAALQEHANGLVFLLVMLSPTKTVALLHIVERGYPCVKTYVADFLTY